MKDSGKTEYPKLTLSLAAFLARIYRRLGKERESRRLEAAYGRRCADLYMRYDQDTQSWRMSLPCVFKDLNPYSKTLPRSGMMRNGTVYRLQPLVPLTKGTESGLLPTPVANEGAGGMFLKLTDAVEILEGRELKYLRRKFPTPMRSDGGKYKVKKRNQMSGYRQLAHAISETGQTGELNPNWVEWLMGFPTGWTDLDS